MRRFSTTRRVSAQIHLTTSAKSRAQEYEEVPQWTDRTSVATKNFWEHGT
jgi:hypothetical protein